MWSLPMIGNVIFANDRSRLGKRKTNMMIKSPKKDKETLET